MTREEAYTILSNGLVNAPSEHEWCMAFITAIKALEQEPCVDAVSRQAVLDALDKGKYSNTFCEEHNIDWSINLGMAHIVVNELELVTPQPKTGHWINQHVILANATIDFKVCSECRYEFSYDAETGVSDANYCPNCGAKMESEDKE